MLALAAIPSLTDAELRLMTNMIAELLERLIMRGIQLEEWLIAKTEYGYLTTSWETHNYISNIQMFVGRWVEYLVDIRKDIEDQNKVVVIAVPMQEVVQCQDRKIQEVDIDDETTVESAGEYTDAHSSANDIIEDDNVCSDVTIPAASIMNSDVMDDDAVSMIRMDIVNKMKHNSYRACNKLCVAQNLAEIPAGFELSQDAVEEWVLALAAIPSLTDAELRLMTNMIAELLE